MHHFEDTKGVKAERIGTKGQTTIYNILRGKVPATRTPLKQGVNSSALEG